jgi:2-polyprenyl-3-methyl-5-hydroxy-6-metoxy-1,4-benzoquinol methylase
MVHYSVCPACHKNDISFEFNAKDNTVTTESFAVWSCSHCCTKFTQDVANENEIGKYYQSENYISHSDTQKGLVNLLYHKVRQFTLVGKRKLVCYETRKSKGNLLDIGCGTGAFINIMKQSSWSVTGLEPDSTASEKAGKLYGIKPQPSEALFHLTENNYDVITMWHVLEHVHKLDEYINQCKKLLKPTGVLIIAVPNHTSYDASFYKENWAAYDVPRHLYHFSPEGMSLLMQRHGLKVDKVKPMWFDSFYVSMLSEAYRYQKVNLLRAFLVGFYSNLKCLFAPQKCSSVIYIIRPITAK